MKKISIAVLTLLVICAIPVLAQVEKTNSPEELTYDKVIEMTKAGLSAETIINTIIASNAAFSMTVKDVLYLRNNGVDEEVINFMLRTKPVTSEPEVVAEEAMEEEDYQGQEELPAYVADAAEGNYYDGYEYTDGYDLDDRSMAISYHYYGPWFRYNPWYFGFYYYPSSFYYYCYWPDDYYYYYYTPRLWSWHYYYYYPAYYNYGYYHGRGGYVKVKNGRYITRWGGEGRDRYAVPRNSGSGTTISPRSTSVMRKDVSPTRTRYYSGSRYEGAGNSSTTRSRSVIYRNGTPGTRQYSTPSTRTRSSITTSRSRVSPSKSSYTRSSGSSVRSSTPPSRSPSYRSGSSSSSSNRGAVSRSSGSSSRSSSSSGSSGRKRN